jgi:hypothetical protein
MNMNMNHSMENKKSIHYINYIKKQQKSNKQQKHKNTKEEHDHGLQQEQEGGDGDGGGGGRRGRGRGRGRGRDALALEDAAAAGVRAQASMCFSRSLIPPGRNGKLFECPRAKSSRRPGARIMLVLLAELRCTDGELTSAKWLGSSTLSWRVVRHCEGRTSCSARHSVEVSFRGHQ